MLTLSGKKLYPTIYFKGLLWKQGREKIALRGLIRYKPILEERKQKHSKGSTIHIVLLILNVYTRILNK